MILISPKGDKMRYVLRMNFRFASNNEAEYEALLHGMRMAKACGATRLKIFGDSKLVVKQVMKKCDAVSDNMIAYRELYNQLEGSFDGCELSHISRASNEEADTLANIGSTRAPVPEGVFLEKINERSIKVKATEVETSHSGAGPETPTSAMIDTTHDEILALTLAEGASWTKPYIAYLTH